MAPRSWEIMGECARSPPVPARRDAAFSQATAKTRARSMAYAAFFDYLDNNLGKIV